MNKHLLFKITLFAGASATAFVLYLLFMVPVKMQSAEAASPKQEKGVYDETCFTPIQKDTLIQLFKTAYGSAIEITRDADELKLNYTASDQSAPELYNGNEALLSVDEEKAGFGIEKTKSGLKIEFRIYEDMANVPNDLLIRILSKYELNRPDTLK